MRNALHIPIQYIKIDIFATGVNCIEATDDTWAFQNMHVTCFQVLD